MKTGILIEQIQKITEFETEVNWYLEKYHDNITHPWEKFINRLFLDFKILLPELLDCAMRPFLIGLTILVYDYKLVQGKSPGTYRIMINENTYLDEVPDVLEYMVYTIGRLITFYFNANEKDGLEKLENLLIDEVTKWNWHAWVKQEEVLFLLSDPINQISKEVSLTERNIPQVLTDYHTRIDNKRLENLDSFLSKSEDLINSSEKVKAHAQFFTFILNEINNGGENLNSFHDIFPQYSGVKFN